jgi:hypothetical protein
VFDYHAGPNGISIDFHMLCQCFDVIKFEMRKLSACLA